LKALVAYLGLADDRDGCVEITSLYKCQGKYNRKARLK
jgi:hypothetical protein